MEAVEEKGRFDLSPSIQEEEKGGGVGGWVVASLSDGSLAEKGPEMQRAFCFQAFREGRVDRRLSRGEARVRIARTRTINEDIARTGPRAGGKGGGVVRNH